MVQISLRSLLPFYAGGRKWSVNRNIVVDLDQHVRQTRRAHMTTEPAFQTVKIFVCFLAGLFRGIDRKAPSVFVHAGIAVARRGLEKEIVGPGRTVYFEGPRVETLG